MNIVTPEATRLGWVGTGVMGSSMCAQLLAKGYPVTVSTRTRTKAAALLEAGLGRGRAVDELVPGGHTVPHDGSLEVQVDVARSRAEARPEVDPLGSDLAAVGVTVDQFLADHDFLAGNDFSRRRPTCGG